MSCADLQLDKVCEIRLVCVTKICHSGTTLGGKSFVNAVNSNRLVIRSCDAIGLFSLVRFEVNVNAASLQSLNIKN
jgi:hypothetical protein